MAEEDPSEMSCEELEASKYRGLIISYDANGNNLIDTEENLQAIKDYMDDKITKDETDAVTRAWQLGCDLSDWEEEGWYPGKLVTRIIDFLRGIISR